MSLRPPEPTKEEKRLREECASWQNLLRVKCLEVVELRRQMHYEPPDMEYLEQMATGDCE